MQAYDASREAFFRTSECSWDLSSFCVRSAGAPSYSSRLSRIVFLHPYNCRCDYPPSQCRVASTRRSTRLSSVSAFRIRNHTPPNLTLPLRFATTASFQIANVSLAPVLSVACVSYLFATLRLTCRLVTAYRSSNAHVLSRSTPFGFDAIAEFCSRPRSVLVTNILRAYVRLHYDRKVRFFTFRLLAATLK